MHITSANICGILKNKWNNCVCALLRQYQKFMLIVPKRVWAVQCCEWR